ncbi:hypothetical protein [Bradyrhizobium sp. UFLA05-112]
MLLKIDDALLDQGAVALPLDQGLLEQVDEALGLTRVVATGHKIANPLLLVAHPLPAFLDILIGLDEKSLLGMELLGTLGK